MRAGSLSVRINFADKSVNFNNNINLQTHYVTLVKESSRSDKYLGHHVIFFIDESNKFLVLPWMINEMHLILKVSSFPICVT